MRSIAMSVSVCLSVSLLSVCPLAYLKNHTSKFHQIFYTGTYYLWSWLSPPLRYVSDFEDDVIFSHNGANGPDSKTTRIDLCFVKFAKWRHQGRSLPSPTVSCFELPLNAAYRNSGGRVEPDGIDSALLH